MNTQDFRGAKGVLILCEFSDTRAHTGGQGSLSIPGNAGILPALSLPAARRGSAQIRRSRRLEACAPRKSNLW